MVNQNPQPELYTAHFNINGNGAVIGDGTTYTREIYTGQNFNEEVRIYGLKIAIIGTSKQTNFTYKDATTTSEFQIVKCSIQCATNIIPSQSFNVLDLLATEEKVMKFSSPVLVTHRQPLAVNLEMTQLKNGFLETEDVSIKITLIAESYIRVE